MTPRRRHRYEEHTDPLAPVEIRDARHDRERERIRRAIRVERNRGKVTA